MAPVKSERLPMTPIPVDSGRLRTTPTPGGTSGSHFAVVLIGLTIVGSESFWTSNYIGRILETSYHGFVLHAYSATFSATSYETNDTAHTRL